MSDAAKEKAAKPQVYRLLLSNFPRALKEVARCGEAGSIKHGRLSFLNSHYPTDGLLDAACRHICDLAIDGEINEKDGGVYHRAQIAWGALASLEKVLIMQENILDNPEQYDLDLKEE